MDNDRLVQLMFRPVDKPVTLEEMEKLQVGLLND